LRLKLLVAAMALATPAAVLADHHANPAMEAALAQDNRADDRARDQYRHPAETLAFFQVEPGMTVADFMPSGGWYTRVLVPYLGADGHYIGLNPDPALITDPGGKDYASKMVPRFAEQSAAWNLSGAKVDNMATGDLTDAHDGTVDRALIFREMHNMKRWGSAGAELDRIHDLLKDDGMLGIVQHRARADAPDAYVDGSKGYLRQQDVIDMVEQHGFELVEASEINANAKDPANWEGGVWSLPPSYSGAEDEATRTARAAIGESDRMTLLFRKRG
jgi:predicted methyltransferase